MGGEMEWIMRRSRMQMEENEGEREKKGGGGGELKQLRVLIAFMLFFRFVPASLSDRTPRTPLCPYFFSPISRRCRIGRIRKIDQRNFLGLCFLPSFPFFSNLLYKC